MSNPTVRIEIEGVKEFMAEVRKIASDGKKTTSALLLEAAAITHSEAVRSITTGSRSGNLYSRWKGQKSHRASAEGEAPKSDTGNLIQNLTLEKETGGYSVGSRKGAPYGFWLEFGTSGMGARPWLAPAFEKMVKKFLVKYNG